MTYSFMFASFVIGHRVAVDFKLEIKYFKKLI